MEDRQTVGMVNKKANIPMAGKLILLAVVAMILWSMIFSIKNILSRPDCTPEEGLQKLSDAQTIVLEGRKSWVNARPLIEADGEIIGRFKEKGFFNTKYQIKSGKKIFCYYKFGAPELSKEPIANSYTYYDSEDKVIGYAQETSTDLADGTREYVYLYYDADGNQKPYYLDSQGGWKICSMDGTVQVEAKLEYDMRSVYTITIKNIGDTAVEYQDKMLLFNRILSELKTNNLYE